ncbi:MAG: hypothetical protein WKG07_23175 [Hymenobacter sp.]
MPLGLTPDLFAGLRSSWEIDHLGQAAEPSPRRLPARASLGAGPQPGGYQRGGRRGSRLLRAANPR